ncbi:MAG: hypothetical protein RLN60_00785 [Phycisphaerales bacterium]
MEANTIRESGATRRAEADEDLRLWIAEHDRRWDEVEPGMGYWERAEEWEGRSCDG